MKKLCVALMSLFMVLSLSACGGNDKPQEPTTTPVPTETSEPSETVEPIDASKVMSHEEYMAAELESLVTVEAYVQGHQSWWDNKVTVYAQDQDGAYFFYNLACSEEDAAKLVPGTKILVEGYKAEWSGEFEIMDGRFEIVENADTFVAEAADLTSLLGTEELAAHQNEKVAFKGLTVEASTNADGEEVAFLYGGEGTGSKEANSDLYFNVSYNGETFTFCVESYLCDNTTDVYAAVEALEIGDVIDCEGFLYWYNGANPHITSLTVNK